MYAVLAATVTAVIGPGLLHLLNRRDVRRQVGSPNGQGNVTQIAERIEDKVDGLDRRMAGVEGRVAGVEGRIAVVEVCARAHHQQEE